MNLQARWILGLGAALLLACGDKGGEETTGSTGDGTTAAPTTSGGTTGTPTTTGAGSSSEGSSGEPAHSCLVNADQPSCMADPLCEWKGVVQFAHGVQGCQGSVADLCGEEDEAGGASAWYREVGGDAQVVEFGYTPPDLGPEWIPCTCDGPLACLCTSITEECPERLEEFCGGIQTDVGCEAANIKGTSRCAWLSVSPEGPNDGMCEDDAAVDGCIPAENGSVTMCTPPVYSFLPCIGYGQELFWRDVDGTIEVTTTCGPQPIGFTRCEGDDTPEQPDECKCRCL